MQVAEPMEASGINAVCLDQDLNEDATVAGDWLCIISNLTTGQELQISILMWLCSGDPGRSQLKNARHNEIPLKKEREIPLKKREREREEREWKNKNKWDEREPEKYKQNIPLKISLWTKIIKHVKKYNTEKDSQ